MGRVGGYTDAKAVAAAEGDSDLLNPSGEIIIWHGTIANIPTGWVICDGNNSTPNLLAKFVEGVATAATDPGATGGATNKTTVGHQHTLPLSIPSATATRIGYDLDEFGAGDDITQSHYAGSSPTAASETRAGVLSKNQTDSIADIRPLYYDVAFLMKT